MLQKIGNFFKQRRQRRINELKDLIAFAHSQDALAFKIAGMEISFMPKASDFDEKTMTRQEREEYERRILFGASEV